MDFMKNAHAKLHKRTLSFKPCCRNCPPKDMPSAKIQSTRKKGVSGIYVEEQFPASLAAQPCPLQERSSNFPVPPTCRQLVEYKESHHTHPLPLHGMTNQPTAQPASAEQGSASIRRRCCLVSWSTLYAPCSLGGGAAGGSLCQSSCSIMLPAQS